MRLWRLAVIIIGLSLGGCDPTLPAANDPSEPPPDQPRNFNFETCKTIRVELRVEDQNGDPVPRAPISVISKRSDARRSGTTEGVIIEGAPGNNGRISALVSVPVTQQTLTVETDVSGTSQRESVQIRDGFVEHTIVASSTTNTTSSSGLTIFQPASNFLSTLVFEDLWPTEGDLDVNDIVVDYRFQMRATTNGSVSSIQALIITRAAGTSLENGFGILIPIKPSLVSQVSGARLEQGIVNTRPNGTEANTDETSIIIYENAENLFDRLFVNTTSGRPFTTPDTLQLSIDFTQPVDSTSLGTAPFNPFIFTRGERGREVHLPGYPPTSLVNSNLFGTRQDATNPQAGRYYLSSNNLPWALNLCNGFIYPREKIRIESTYLHFEEWVNSEGENFKDWYTNTSDGYRNESNLYMQGLN